MTESVCEVDADEDGVRARGSDRHVGRVGPVPNGSGSDEMMDVASPTPFEGELLVRVFAEGTVISCDLLPPRRNPFKLSVALFTVLLLDRLPTIHPLSPQSSTLSSSSPSLCA